MLFQAFVQNDYSGILAFMFILFLFLLFFAVVISLFVFWIWMIVDCAQRKRLSDGERIAWILVLVFLGSIGAVVYYFAVKRNHP